MKLLIGGNSYGFGNIGDDAALSGIVASIAASVPSAELAIESKDGGRIPWLKARHRGIRVNDWNGFRRELEECDAFIVGGGTMIGCELNLQYPLIHLARRVALASLLKKRVIFWGCGANRMESPDARGIASAILKAASLCFFRDRESADNALDLGADSETTAYHADPAYLVVPEKTERTEAAVARIRSAGSQTIGVNLLNEVWASDESYKISVALALDRIHSETGAVPVFFANEIRTGSFYDMVANMDCAGRLKCPSVTLYPEYYSPGEMLEILSAFDAVFSMRMHAMILASSAGVPFDGISRVNKVDHFFAQFGRKACCAIGDVDADRIHAALLVCLGRKRGSDAEIVDGLRRRARECGERIADMFPGLRAGWRCPIEILRYAPTVRPIAKLPTYLSYGPRGIAELLAKR